MSEEVPKEVPIAAFPGGSEGDVSIDLAKLQLSKKETAAPIAIVVEESPEFIRLKTEGNELFKSGNYQGALEKYDEALNHAKNPEQIGALLHNKGWSFEKMENVETALMTYTEAIDKKPGYEKVLRRRSKLLCSVGRYQEAVNDVVEITVSEMKNKNLNTSELTQTAKDLMDIICKYAECEAKEVISRREATNPPDYVVESTLRTFYGDPISRFWKSMDPHPVDEMMANGTADSLTGYLAALRDLKLRKYEAVRDHCTFEIENPTSEENQLYAYFLRGTMGLIWASADETSADFHKVIESPLADDKLKSSAYLKLALQNSSTRMDPTISTLYDDYEQSEKLWVENPDVYYHGALTLIERAHPQEGMEMLEMGIRLAGKHASVLMKTLYWTLKFSLTGDENERHAAYQELVLLEPTFDIPDCHELYAQALLVCGESRADDFSNQFDKAIAYNPQDPVFKMKKIIMGQWMTPGDEEAKENALEQLYKFIEENGPNSLAYYQIGQMETIMGNTEKGIEALDKSIELSSSIHEIEARIASKLEIQFHLKVNERLREEGLEPFDDLSSLALKSFGQ